MDEPFAAVDAATERAIVQILQDLKQAGKTMVIVHHDLQTVKEYFDHVILIEYARRSVGADRRSVRPENLQKTYGGKLTLLDQASEALRREGRSSARTGQP